MVLMSIIEAPLYTDEKNTDMLKTDFYGLIDVENRINEVLLKAEGIIKDMCMYLFNCGGKRLRPLMVLCSGLCFSDLTPDMINTAAAAELIHMASLVHDDVIDKSDSRRGMESINSIYGNHAAVLAGDYLFAEAFDILSYNKLLKSMDYLVEAIQKMCCGEVRQADDRFNTGITVNDYFDRIAKKTGILISSCCRAGAAAANASDMEINIMNEYGLYVGYAFQIIDDILDFTGDEKKLGKPVGMDLLNGNITLPVILLMNNENYRMKVKSILRKGYVSNAEFEYISEALEKSGAIKSAYYMAEKCVSKAKLGIYDIKDSVYKSLLLEKADKIINREF
jgi:heptaprenyl diphosphate synthase